MSDRRLRGFCSADGEHYESDDDSSSSSNSNSSPSSSSSSVSSSEPSSSSSPDSSSSLSELSGSGPSTGSCSSSTGNGYGFNTKKSSVSANKRKTDRSNPWKNDTRRAAKTLVGSGTKPVSKTPSGNRGNFSLVLRTSAGPRSRLGTNRPLVKTSRQEAEMSRCPWRLSEVIIVLLCSLAGSVLSGYEMALADRDSTGPITGLSLSILARFLIVCVAMLLISFVALISICNNKPIRKNKKDS